MTYRANVSGGTLYDKAKDVEGRVLGTILNSPETLSLISVRLKPDNFQHERHRIIFKGMLELKHENIPVDMSSLCDLLEKLGALDAAGGLMYLMYLHDALRTEEMERLNAESGLLLAWGNRGGSITSENGDMVARNRRGEVVYFDW